MVQPPDNNPDPSGDNPKEGLFYTPSQLVQRMALAFSTLDERAHDLPALTTHQIKRLEEALNRMGPIDMSLFDYPVSELSNPVFWEATAALRKAMDSQFFQFSEISDQAPERDDHFRVSYGLTVSTDWPFGPVRWIDRDLLLAVIDLEEGTHNQVHEGPSVTATESDRLKRIITSIYHQEKSLLKVAPYDFEQMIAELLRYKGYEVDLTKRTRDGGFDVLAISRDQGGFPLKFLVECKRYTAQKVGVEVVRQLLYVVQAEQANKGIIATSSYFSADAVKEASHQPYLLDLRDKNDILGWIRQYGEERLLLRKG